MHPARRWVAVAAGLCLAAAGQGVSAAANDLVAAGLDALLDVEVTGTSKFSLRMSESASSVTVISAEQMRALGHRTLADVLRSVRGLVVSSDRTYHYLAVRGFSTAGDYNTRVLLLIDGNRVNDTIYDQAMLGSEFPLDIDLVERVEFIPGQGSAVHGANALFGVVNVITRRAPATSSAETALSLGHGQWRQLRVSGSQPIAGDGQLLLSASVWKQAGTDAYYPGFDAPETNNGTSRRTDHERGRQLFAKFSRGEWSATLVHGDRTKGLTAIPSTVFGDPATLYRDTQTMADLSLQHPLDALSHWKLRLYGGRYDFRGDYLIDVPPLTLNRDGSASRWWGAEAVLFTERFDAHKLVAGADVQFSPRRDQWNIDVWPEPANYLDDKRSGRRFSLFAEDQWTWSPSVTLTAGARLDRQQGASTQFSPRLAAVWRPHAEWVFKAIHGSAYRPPNAYEAYYSTPPASGGYKANPSLRNERVRGHELVAEWRPSAASRWTISAYRNEAHGLLVQQLDPDDDMLVYRNAGALRAQGLEIEAEQAWPSGAQLRGNLGLQRVKDVSGLGLAEHNASRVAKLVALWPLPRGWMLGGETVAVGRRGDVPGYGVTQLTLSAALPRGRGHVSLSVHDLFDRQPSDPGSDSALQPTAPQDGRSLRLKFELKFQ